MSELLPIEIEDSLVLDDLGVRLNGARREHPLELAADHGDWDIGLVTTEDGTLQAASMTRFGQERYAFERMESGNWAPKDTRTMFAHAHFYNLVHMASMNGLEWATSPAV